MADWKTRVVTGFMVAPIIVFMLHQQFTTALLAHFMVFMSHNEYSKIIASIMKFNSSESDAWYIETMEQSIFIRIPTHYLLTACALSNNDTTLHLHLILAIFMVCSVRIYNFIKISHFLKDKGRTIDIKVSVQSLDRKLYILSFFQMGADFIQLLLFVYPLAFPLIVFQYKQGAAINIIWALSTWQTDNGALIFGSMLGKHAFVPKISPKKTWEGVSGGIFLSVFTALILSQLNVLSMVHLDPVHTKHFLIISLIVSVVSIFGDFVESFLKRVADVKDSGTFFPGHGGVLDRMDSLCFSAPFVYLYLKLILPSTLDLADA